MKIVRVLSAFSLALLAAPAFAAVPSSKPPAADVPPPPPPAAPGVASAPAPDEAPPVASADESKPVETPAPAPAPADAPKRSGSDVQAWFDGLSLPGWIAGSGMPVWAWALLGTFAFIFLRGLLRGGGQRDLIGPPPHMRLGARANPPAPRRADPPQRG